MSRKNGFAICLALWLLAILVISSVPVSAQADWSAVLKIEQISGGLEEETVSVRISVEQITSPSGILCASFEVHYDQACLELISWENSRPNGWDFSETQAYAAEDWTMVKQGESGAYLMYTLLNSALTNGVKEDGELYTELRFKVLSSDLVRTAISVTDITFTDEELMESCYLPDSEFLLTAHNASEESNTASDGTTSGQAEISGESNQSQAGSSETGSALSAADETAPATRIAMLITVEDIADTAGISCLQFTLAYNPSVLQYIRYECLLPDDWDLNTDFTEDLTSLNAEAGNLVFCIMNNEQGHGVKQGGVLGFRVEFAIRDAEFDPSMITLKDALLINDRLEDVSADNYRLSVRYEIGDTSLSENAFSSNETEGKTVKILIAILSSIVILAAAVCTFLVIRKKKPV